MAKAYNFNSIKEWILKKERGAFDGRSDLNLEGEGRPLLKIFNTERDGKTPLEKCVDQPDIVDLLKKHGAICYPTVIKLIDAIKRLDGKTFSLLLEFSSGEIINGVDAEGKTPLFYLLKEISEWQGSEIPQDMLVDMLRHPKLNMEGVELNSPQDAVHIIKALQENPFLVQASPISFICHSGSVAEANAEISQLITQNVFNQEAACDDVCLVLPPEIASSIVMGYLGAEMYRGSASAAAAEPDSASNELLGDADHS